VGPVCQELILNGGFESKVAGEWIFGETPRKGQRSDVRAHSGSWSALLGIRPPTSDTFSYSSVRQGVEIPADAQSAQLSFWYWPASEDQWPYDKQQALLYVGDFEDRDLRAVIMNMNSNARAWTRVTFDLLPYKGQTVHLYFNVLNDGLYNLRTWMFLDDVSVTVCR
jgi:hypothetical protein